MEILMYEFISGFDTGCFGDMLECGLDLLILLE